MLLGKILTFPSLVLVCTVDVKFRTNIDDDQYNINARLLLAESQVGGREGGSPVGPDLSSAILQSAGEITTINIHTGLVIKIGNNYNISSFIHRYTM